MYYQFLLFILNSFVSLFVPALWGTEAVTGWDQLLQCPSSGEKANFTATWT